MVEAVYCTDEVGVYEVALPAIQPGLGRGLGGAFDQQIETSRIGEILAIANVAMATFDAALRQPAQSQFAAASLQVIERDDCIVGLARLNDRARCEPTNPTPPIIKIRIDSNSQRITYLGGWAFRIN
jgi:hypothetical protein